MLPPPYSSRYFAMPCLLAPGPMSDRHPRRTRVRDIDMNTEGYQGKRFAVLEEPTRGAFIRKGHAPHDAGGSLTMFVFVTSFSYV